MDIQEKAKQIGTNAFYTYYAINMEDIKRAQTFLDSCLSVMKKNMKIFIAAMNQFDDFDYITADDDNYEGNNRAKFLHLYCQLYFKKFNSEFIVN